MTIQGERNLISRFWGISAENRLHCAIFFAGRCRKSATIVLKFPLKCILHVQIRDRKFHTTLQQKFLQQKLIYSPNHLKCYFIICRVLWLLNEKKCLPFLLAIIGVKKIWDEIVCRALVFVHVAEREKRAGNVHSSFFQWFISIFQVRARWRKMILWEFLLWHVNRLVGDLV